MTDEIQENPVADKPKRKRVRTQEKRILTIDGGQVVPQVVKEEIVEEPETIVLDSDKPRIKFSTPDGEAIYEYAGNCVDCGNKRPAVETPVFRCVTNKIRADEQIGYQLAAFRRDGHASSAICKNCYDAWRNARPKQEARFKVL